MPEHPHIRTPSVTEGQAARRTAGASVNPASAPASARSRPVAPKPVAPESVDGGGDPVTDWLLQRDDLDTTEFSVLFAIHKLRARRRSAGWIGHAELRRCTGLAPDAVGRVLTVLRHRGFIWMAPHPVKSGYARYLLVVQ